MNGEPFGTIRIGVQTVFLKSEVQTRLMRAAYISVALIFVSLFLAAGISNLALGPLKEISRNLDSVSAGEAESLYSDESKHDEYGLVSLKIANLGRQIRDSKEIFSALKDNVDQLMAKLQDGLMLFSRDSRVVLVSAPVEAFLGRPRGELLGHTVQEVFDRDSLLGRRCSMLSSADGQCHSASLTLPGESAFRFHWTSCRRRLRRSALFSSCGTRSRSGALATKSRCHAGFPPADA